MTDNRINSRHALGISRKIGLLAGFALVLSLTLFSACDTLITEQTIIILDLESEFVAVCPDGTVSDTGCTGCVPFTVNFQDTSEGRRTQWAWNFGDGSVSNDTNPTHTYDTAGLYRVSLLITDDTTKVSDLEIKNRFIFVGAAVTGFTTPDSLLTLGDSLTFTPFPDDGFAHNWLWVFGDGDSSTVRAPTHVYNDTGIFDVKLIATCYADSAFEDTTEIVKSSLIQIVQRPVVKIIMQKDTNICAPTSTIFIDSTAHPLPAIVQSRIWDFRNGQSSINRQFSADYDTPGAYWVKLTVTTNRGGTATDSILATVNEVAQAKIGVISDTILCVGVNETVSFEDSSSGTIVNYLWKFGDGSFSNSQNPVHSYSAPGIYSCTLIVFGTCDIGGIDSLPDTTIRPNLILLADTLFTDSAGFSLSATTGDTNTVFIMTDTTSGIATDWLWIFNDTGQIGIDSSEQFRFTVDGTYEIKMYIKNDCMTDSVFAVNTVIVSTP